MKEVVEGDLIVLDRLKEITDWSSIRKVCQVQGSAHICSSQNDFSQYYKLNNDTAVSALQKNPARQNAVVDELVTSFVAMKSVMS